MNQGADPVQSCRDGAFALGRGAALEHHRGELRHGRAALQAVHPAREDDPMDRDGGHRVVREHVQRDPVAENAVDGALRERGADRRACGLAARCRGLDRPSRARALLRLPLVGRRGHEPSDGRVVGNEVGGRDPLDVRGRDPLHRVDVVHEPLPVRGGHRFAEARGKLVGAVTPADHGDLELVLRPVQLLARDARARHRVERVFHRVLHLLVAHAGGHDVIVGALSGG